MARVTRRHKFFCNECPLECMIAFRIKPLRHPVRCMWVGKPKWVKYNPRLERLQAKRPTGSDTSTRRGRGCLEQYAEK